jgi:hypothetical protein
MCKIWLCVVVATDNLHDLRRKSVLHIKHFSHAIQGKSKSTDIKLITQDPIVAQIVSSHSITGEPFPALSKTTHTPPKTQASVYQSSDKAKSESTESRAVLGMSLSLY